jgi:hypothetical protein
MLTPLLGEDVNGMYLSLDLEQQYVFEDISDHSVFVNALPLLVTASDIIVFRTYESRRDVRPEPELLA